MESYQRLKKWYLIPPCLTLSNIRYVSRVKWSNPGKGVAPYPTHWYNSYWQGSLLVAFDSGLQLLFVLFFTFQEIRNKSDLIEDFKIVNGISNYRIYLFQIFLHELKIYSQDSFQILSLLTNCNLMLIEQFILKQSV